MSPDLPLRYRIEEDEDGPAALWVETEGGDVLVKFTPWGPHAEPHTGHPGLDAKQNWLGYLAPSSTELVELEGDGDGVCEVEELCGLPEETVMARRPRYVAPDDHFEIFEVLLDRVHEPGFYFGTLNHWRIMGRLGDKYLYLFGHVGWIAEDLRAAMLEAGAPDPDTYTGPTWTNLLKEPIALSRGATIAIPQIVGGTSPAHPGMVVGDVWAQMEVPTRRMDLDADQAIYAWLDPSVRKALQAILWREMEDPGAAEGAPDPVIPAELPCDGSLVLCRNHQWQYPAPPPPGY